MLTIDLNRDHSSFVLTDEHGHTMTLPNTWRGYKLMLQLLVGRTTASQKPGLIGTALAPIQYDIDRYLAREPSNTDAIKAWLEKNPIKKLTRVRNVSTLSLEDLDLASPRPKSL